MKTQDEIVARIQERMTKDPLAFETQIYSGFIDFDHAKPLLAVIAPKATAEGWKVENQDTILHSMEEYMGFAWSKANDCRGISAVGSLQHYIAWIWMLGDEAFAAEVQTDMESNYRFYGKEILIKICEKYGWDHSQYDDGIRTNE